MLRDAPGVYPRKWGGDVRISIRGSGIGNANHNRGLLGRRAVEPTAMAITRSPTAARRYVGVISRRQRLRFGGSLLGGAINVVTPMARLPRTRSRIDGGSFRPSARTSRSPGKCGMCWSPAPTSALRGYRPQGSKRPVWVTEHPGEASANREVR
jgi:iron complex outermembrane receptor protein